MRTRILPPSEWAQLNNSELMRYVNPDNVSVIIVEKEGEILASVMVLKVTHFEQLWIKPEERGNAGVFRALIRQAYASARANGERFVLADAADDRMDSICRRLGGKDLSRTFFALPVGA